MSLTLDGTAGISTTGNIVGNNIVVTGSFAPTTLSVTGNIQGGNLSTAGNVTGNYLLGNGTFITGLSASKIFNGTSEANIGTSGGNANITIGGVSNVVVISSAGISVAGTVQTSGNITGGNIIYGSGAVSGTGTVYAATVNAATIGNTGAVHNGATVSITGNITASYFIGNGYTLTSINGANVVGLNTAAISNGTSNVNISTSGGNITAGVGGTPNVAVIATTGISVAGTIQASGNITGGNISIGSGASTAGSYSASGNVTGGNLIASGVLISTNTISVAGNITGGNIIYGSGVISGTGQIDAATVSVSGNVTGGNLLFGSGVVSGTGNINGANLTVTAGIYNGNISIIGANIVSAGPTLYIDPNGAGGTDGNVIITGNLTVQGTTTTINSNTVTTNDLFINVANNAATASAANGGGLGVGPIGSEYASLLYSSGANTWQTSIPLSVTGAIQASGNISASYFIGNGYTLTSINGANVTGLNTAAISNGTSNVNIATSGGNITASVGGTPNVVVTATTGISVAGTIQSSGNITGGNISIGSGSSTAGSYSATGNVTGGNVIYGTGAVSGTGTVYAATVNAATIGNASAVHNGATVSATGNVTGGNLIASGVLISTNTISASGNITGGNISIGSGASTAGSYSASGNITGGNLSVSTGTITVGNIVNANGNAVGNIGSSSLYFNTVFAKATSAQYADLAEMYVADATYLPGTVVSFGGTQEVTESSGSHNTQIAGIISTNPSYLMNSTLSGEHTVAVALTGRVPCRVTGIIHKGDRLVASSINGVAGPLDMIQYQPGCIIGKALEAWNSDEIGTIEVAVGKT